MAGTFGGATVRHDLASCRHFSGRLTHELCLRRLFAQISVHVFCVDFLSFLGFSTACALSRGMSTHNDDDDDGSEIVLLNFTLRSNGCHRHLPFLASEGEGVGCGSREWQWVALQDVCLCMRGEKSIFPVR